MVCWSAVTATSSGRRASATDAVKVLRRLVFDALIFAFVAMAVSDSLWLSAFRIVLIVAVLIQDRIVSAEGGCTPLQAV